MTSQTRAVNQARFEEGDVPHGTDFADLIDSFVSLADTAAQTVASDLHATNFITTGSMTASTFNLTNINATNITGNVSAAVLTGNQAGITSVSATNLAAGALAVTGVVSASSVWVDGLLTLVSGAGSSTVIKTTAGNPVDLNTITSAGGRTMCRGFVRFRVEGTVAYMPFFYAT